MSAQDYRVNAEIRRYLVSRWVDIGRLQIATTNGVVYLIGNLEPSVENALERAGHHGVTDPGERVIHMITMLEKEMRRTRGVRDVVFNLRNVKKTGRTWRVAEGGNGSDPNVKRKPVSPVASPVRAPRARR